MPHEDLLVTAERDYLPVPCMLAHLSSCCHFTTSSETGELIMSVEYRPEVEGTLLRGSLASVKTHPDLKFYRRQLLGALVDNARFLIPVGLQVSMDRGHCASELLRVDPVDNTISIPLKRATTATR